MLQKRFETAQKCYARFADGLCSLATPQLPKKASVRPDGQVVAPVFPTDKWDALLFGGFEAEIWMDTSVTPSSLPDTMAVLYDAMPSELREMVVRSMRTSPAL